MYIAGLNVPVTSTQALNALSWISALVWFSVCLPSTESQQRATREAGPTKFMPPGKKGKIVSFVHAFGVFIPMATFVVSLPLSVFHTPRWLAFMSLSMVEEHRVYVGLRVAGCVGTFMGAMMGKAVFKHLGAQLGMIGVSTYYKIPIFFELIRFLQVRERPKVVKTGPYSIVRHPGYRSVIVSQLQLEPG
jgi:hypothetical protein